MRIERQSEHYSYTDPALLDAAEEQDAYGERPPAEALASLLGGKHITPGMLHYER